MSRQSSREVRRNNGVVDQDDAGQFDWCIVNAPSNGRCLAAFDFNTNAQLDINDGGVMAGLLGTAVGAPASICLTTTETSTAGPSKASAEKRGVLCVIACIY